MQVASKSTTDQEPTAWGLSKLLADTRALQATTRRFQRDIAGFAFIMLRSTLERQGEELGLASDAIAERMRAIGQPVAPPHRDLVGSPPLHRGQVWAAQEMIARLTERHEIVARRARSILRLAARARDQATCDLLVARIRAHEKSAWALAAIGIAELIRTER